jgi:hypothetical protein
VSKCTIARKQLDWLLGFSYNTTLY